MNSAADIMYINKWLVPFDFYFWC